MRGENHTASPVSQPSYRGHRCTNPGGVGHSTAGERYVEIDADKGPETFERLTLERVEGALHSRSARNAIRSMQRLEYPISLSYHDDT